jgi:hypothetical protein
MNSAGSVRWSMRVFELATWHGRGDLDNGPSKLAANAAESGSWGCQVDSQEMGEVAASWEVERGSINYVLSRPLYPGNMGSWVRGSAPLCPENMGSWVRGSAPLCPENGGSWGEPAAHICL